MKAKFLLNVMAFLLINHGTAYAEYFQSGYPVCESKERLNELLTFAKAKNSNKIYEYTSVRGWCVYAKDALVQVLSLNADGKAHIRFSDGGIDGWTPIKAVKRRAHPPKRNVFIPDPANPDGDSVCHMISQFTRLPNAKRDIVAKSVLAMNSNSKTSSYYRRGIAEREYELFTAWNGNRCVGELDVPSRIILACVLDYQKYYSCRRKQTSDVEECYNNLCVEPVASFQ